jgi:hypothetical protein
MRGWIVVVAMVVACKGGKAKEPATGSAPVAKAAAATVAVPKIATASVLAIDDGKPTPYLMVFDASGNTVHVNAFASWKDVATKDLMKGAKGGSGPEILDAIDRMMREEFALGRKAMETVPTWDFENMVALDLPSLEEQTRDLDDPPPPEEEDKPDDGADESGGTGTAMALEEGKMGKKDSDRAEGQYRMKKHSDSPQELARAPRGERGSLMFASLGDSKPNEDGTPRRLAQVAGEVMPDGKVDPMRAAILAPPAMKAAKLVELVARFEAAIAVAHEGVVRPLRIQFMRSRDQHDTANWWLEARVSAKGVVIEAVPDAPIEVATLDPKALGAAIEKARAARGAEAHAPVDVLVEGDLDAQRLVDVLVALDSAGVRVIGMGPAPDAVEIARRGKRVPTTSIGQPNVQGDLDKAEIRRVVKQNIQKIGACYEKALPADPNLTGTVLAQFFISPKGTVTTVSASGVTPEVSTCVATAIKAFVFPKPKGGGGVQVNYPFTFRP